VPACFLWLPDFDPSLATYIRDSMALVQCMDAKKHKTFGDLATLWQIEISSSQEYFCLLWLGTPLYGQSLWYDALFQPTWWSFLRHTGQNRCDCSLYLFWLADDQQQWTVGPHEKR
jgi:hypothetical protein